MPNKFNIVEYDENIEYESDDVFVLDDRPRKFDEQSGEFVSPGDPRYDNLPDLIL